MALKLSRTLHWAKKAGATVKASVSLNSLFVFKVLQEERNPR